MSMGQMYHYIASKDDVLFLIHKHMQTRWYLTLMDARIEETKDPTEKMKLALHATISFLSKSIFQKIQMPLIISFHDPAMGLKPRLQLFKYF